MSFATKCWSCGSNRFQETTSREYCPDCGIECLYHGSGANKAYNDASDKKHRLQQEQDEKKICRRI